MIIVQNAAESSDTGANAAEEFENAFRKASRSAFLLARQLGRSAEDARDIVQEAATRAWRYRGGRRGEFRPWFLAIVYRVARRPPLDWLPLPTSWDRPVPPGIDSHMDPDLLAALQTLPTRQRAALWLRYCEDLSIGDVARIMRLRESAAKQLLFRGRAALRQKLAPNPLEEKP
jgi:RNA polymerase sigma-70 factor, ECF subfamily